jgi:hypothetical protein
MGGMEVFLPLLEQVKYDESKSSEILNDVKYARETNTEERNTARFVSCVIIIYMKVLLDCVILLCKLSINNSMVCREIWIYNI